MVRMRDGDYNEHSDIDIMILTDLKDKELSECESKIWDLAYDIESNNDFSIETFNYWLQALPFYMNVQKEGVILSEPQSVK